MMKKTLGSEFCVLARSKIFVNLRGYNLLHNSRPLTSLTTHLSGQSFPMDIALPATCHALSDASYECIAIAMVCFSHLFSVALAESALQPLSLQ